MDDEVPLNDWFARES